MLFEKVSDLCEAKGITIWKLEKELKFANASISRWKKSYPSADRLKKVSDYFEVTTDYLLEQDNQISAQSQILAKTVDKLSPAKQDLVKQYIDMIQTS
nr:helix-turn-helix transcriptional regulator [uncultured Caproiciproducens sp.]